MKITCQSCGAKYAIADEKVRGRTVKIRCRKCNTPIVVQGGDSPAPEPESQGAVSSMAPDQQYVSQSPGQDGDTHWMVAMDDGSQQGGTVNLIRELFQSGQIHENTYVWCDGMADWLPLSSVSELWSAVQQGQASTSVQPPQDPVAHAGAFPDPSQPLVPAPGAMSSGLFGSGGHAARVEPGKQYEDLFGAAQEKAEQEQADHVHDEHEMGGRPVVPRFTAERNENSVLFTIDSILSAGKGSPKRTAVAEQEEEKVDFKRLASLPPMSAGDSSSRFNAGAGFGQAALMAPTLPTTIEPDPIPEPVAAVGPDTFDMPVAKSNRGLLIGLGIAIVTLLIVVIAGGFYISNKNTEVAMSKQEAEKAEALRIKEKQEREEKERAQRAEREEEEARARKKAEEEKAKAKEQDAESAEKTAEGTDSKGKTDTSKVAADTKSGSKSGSALATSGASKDDKGSKTDTSSKSDDSTAAKPVDTPAAPAAGGDRAFSRSAAVSALNAAASSAASCKKPDGPTGRGQVSVTFAPSGRVTTANVGGAFAGTSVGGCVASVFRRATVPPFDGSPVTVRKSFTIN